MGFRWLRVLLEYGFLSVFFVQPFGDGGRFISLSIKLLWKEKSKKIPNRHNILTSLYTPILPRDVLCIYCELLKM